MNHSNPRMRYCEYLESFGIAEPGDRVAELPDLDRGGVRFFAFADGGGLRLKAAATARGVVTPGARIGDDWYGFLSAMPDAMTAAKRIAWLESDASTLLHDLPIAPVLALAPDHRPSAAIDPAQWAFVIPPTLFTRSDGTIILVAWFLLSSNPIPQQWTVTARPGNSTAIVCASALEFLLVDAGSEQAVASSAAIRARRLLSSGTNSERQWAMQQIAAIGDRTAIPELAALLANRNSPPNARLQAAGTLARLGDSAAAVPLGAALGTDPSTEVRRECAHAIGRLGGPSAVQVLTGALSREPDVMVRTEIVHALAAQGSFAHTVLAQIARDDADATVRSLARATIPETDALG